jgi:uncharacterized membrane protein YhaH (DUF805 family)
MLLITPARRVLGPALLVTIFSAAIVVIVIWFLIEVGFLKGTQGPNRFGLDPLSPPHGEPAPASLSGRH